MDAVTSPFPLSLDDKTYGKCIVSCNHLINKYEGSNKKYNGFAEIKQLANSMIPYCRLCNIDNCYSCIYVLGSY